MQPAMEEIAMTFLGLMTVRSLEKLRHPEEDRITRNASVR